MSDNLYISEAMDYNILDMALDPWMGSDNNNLQEMDNPDGGVLLQELENMEPQVESEPVPDSAQPAPCVLQPTVEVHSIVDGEAESEERVIYFNAGSASPQGEISQGSYSPSSSGEVLQDDHLMRSGGQQASPAFGVEEITMNASAQPALIEEPQPSTSSGRKGKTNGNGKRVNKNPDEIPMYARDENAPGLSENMKKRIKGAKNAKKIRTIKDEMLRKTMEQNKEYRKQQEMANKTISGLQAEVDALKANVDALKANNNGLRAFIKHLETLLQGVRQFTGYGDRFSNVPQN